MSLDYETKEDISSIAWHLQCSEVHLANIADCLYEIKEEFCE